MPGDASFPALGRSRSISRLRDRDAGRESIGLVFFWSRYF